MRKFLVPLMAATMLVPAAAQAEESGLLRAMRERAERSSQDDNDSDSRRSRAERSDRSERSDSDRPSRAERAPREERASRVERVRRADRADDDRGVHEADRIRAQDHEARRAERDRRADRDAAQVDPVQVNEPGQGTQPAERRRSGLAGAFTGIGRDMADGRDGDGDGDNHRDWRRDRDGDRDWRRDRDGRHRWDRDWRRDRRYDWSDYRNRYRSIFRLGRYYDPYGWGYRRFSIGFSLWPSYYGSSFWLNDPWHYRLPPAYGPYRWVRYYDDALLVDIYTGQVVDVVHNVFW